MASSLLSILVGVWLITCFVAAKAEPYVPALYVFGDSLADAGNNNYIPNCTARANNTPYGVSYFPYPTGRSSNGRLVADFLASCLGLPFAPPYLQKDANFTTGINFASGGSGLLDTLSQNVWNMSHQVHLFEQYYDSLDDNARANIGKSLFSIVIGGNDILSYFIHHDTFPNDFVTLLLSKLEQYIIRLYNHGARKFIVFNIPPVGCTPIARKLVDFIENGNCWRLLNSMVKKYNTNFGPSLTQLRKELDEGTIIQVNTYDFLMNTIENGEAYGFKNTTSACCGSGKFGTETYCGQTDPPNLFCDDPNTYVFWDGGHGSEKVYKLLSEQIWSGNTSVVYPFNLSTLVSGETCLSSNEAPTLSMI